MNQEHCENTEQRGITKIKTGIEGFDHISEGGVPQGRTTLVTGNTGSGKTIFAAQFLAEGIRKYGEPGVFVTFEELPEDIHANMKGLGLDIEKWEAENKWKFVNINTHSDVEETELGSYDLSGFFTRIQYAIEQVGARRVAIDSMGSIFSYFTDASIVRRELIRIFAKLKKLNITIIFTAENTNDSNSLTRFGVEEFIADNVILIRNEFEGENRRRTIEILKYRGTSHQKGTYPFSIMSNKGIEVIPLTAVELKQKSSNKRITTGNENLNQMCGGGFYHDSIILISGATGTGKTLMASEYIRGGAEAGEKCIFFAYEESQEQIIRNIKGWGGDFKKWQDKGNLQINCRYPETATLDDHLIYIKKAIQEFKPDRIAIDSLSALERIGSVKGFREFVVGLTSFIKEQSIACLFTSTTPTMTGPYGRWETHISTITDAIILLRYVETRGSMTRGVVILKMRGSRHDNTIREFLISSKGMEIGESFTNFSGILSGNPFADSIKMDREQDSD